MSVTMIEIAEAHRHSSRVTKALEEIPAALVEVQRALSKSPHTESTVVPEAAVESLSRAADQVEWTVKLLQDALEHLQRR